MKLLFTQQSSLLELKEITYNNGVLWTRALEIQEFNIPSLWQHTIPFHNRLCYESDSLITVKLFKKMEVLMEDAFVMVQRVHVNVYS